MSFNARIELRILGQVATLTIKTIPSALITVTHVTAGFQNSSIKGHLADLDEATFSKKER